MAPSVPTRTRGRARWSADGLAQRSELNGVSDRRGGRMRVDECKCAEECPPVAARGWPAAARLLGSMIARYAVARGATARMTRECIACGNASAALSTTRADPRQTRPVGRCVERVAATAAIPNCANRHVLAGARREGAAADRGVAPASRSAGRRCRSNRATRRSGVNGENAASGRQRAATRANARGPDISPALDSGRPATRSSAADRATTTGALSPRSLFDTACTSASSSSRDPSAVEPTTQQIRSEAGRGERSDDTHCRAA